MNGCYYEKLLYGEPSIWGGLCVALHFLCYSSEKPVFVFAALVYVIIVFNYRFALGPKVSCTSQKFNESCRGIF